MQRERLQKTKSSLWEAWGKTACIGLMVMAVLAGAIIWMTLSSGKTGTSYYPENAEFVARTVLEKGLTINAGTLEDNMAAVRDYSTKDYYASLWVSYIMLAFPEYSTTDSIEELPENLRGEEELKQWLEESGFASSLLVLSTKVTRCDAPGEAEVTVEAVYAVRSAGGYLSQAKQTYKVSLVHEEDNPAGSYWVVDVVEELTTTSNVLR